MEWLRQDLFNLFKWSKVWQMLFNLQKCLIMHSGFEETGLQVRLRGKLLRQRRIKRIWIHVVMQNDVEVWTCNACNAAGASPGESSKFRVCVLTALCKHRGRMNVQRMLTKILFIRGCLGCSYIDMLRFWFLPLDTWLLRDNVIKGFKILRFFRMWIHICIIGFFQVVGDGV